MTDDWPLIWATIPHFLLGPDQRLATKADRRAGVFVSRFISHQGDKEYLFQTIAEKIGDQQIIQEKRSHLYGCESARRSIRIHFLQTEREAQ